jgi:hypothetical protein
MAFSINEIRSQLTFGGARPTLFQVQIQNPVNSLGDLKVPFMVKAASQPPSALGVIEAPYMGRKVKLSGDRTFEPWTVTVINDEDFLIKNALEEWSHSINSHEGNLTSFNSSSPLQYKAQAQITQFSKTGTPIRVYQFNGLWPSEISEVEMNWESTDTIQEFTVTFQYDWWDISGGITGNAGTRD